MKSSEIILNNDGSIYHLCLKPNQVSKEIILVGDPFRVDIISKHLNDIEFTIQNREFKSITGYYNNKRISVISTGIGGSNIDIVINELDALFNYDFTNKCFKNQHESINFIRVGTSGSISKNISVDSWLISEYAIDINSQLSFYDLKNYKGKNIEVISLEDNNFYCFRASDELFQKFYSNNNMHVGLTATCNGFYAFQGRKTRIPLKNKINIENIKSLKLKKYNVTNLEMETAIIYGLSNFLGHNAISINAILANRIDDLYSENPSKVIESLILFTLNKI